MRNTNAVATDNAVATLDGPDPGEIMEQVIVKGDLANLSPHERAAYYGTVCRSMGLNPLTQPFQYIELNRKLTLYATKGATDQLRKLNRVDLRVVSREQIDELCVVTVEARTPDGRTDSDIGVVTVTGLGGDALANAMMKATTKAKRRVTLSICGLGWLDESEVETVPSARVVRVDTESGELLDALPAGDTAAEPDHPVNQRDAFRRDFFGAISAAGIKHPDTQKALCTHIFPDAGSRATYTAAMWADAIAWVTDPANAATIAHFRELSWLARIEACGTAPALGKLAGELGEGGQATDPIRAAFRVRRDEIQATARLDAAAT